MSVKHSNEESLDEWRDLEDDWDDDWDDINTNPIADAAVSSAEAAQDCLSQPDGLQNAFYNTLNSVRLFALSTGMKSTATEKQSEALSGMRGAIAQTLVSIWTSDV